MTMDPDAIREELAHGPNVRHFPGAKGAGKGEKAGTPLIMPATYTDSELAGKKLERPEYLVDGLFPVGLTLISAPPKIGKSWLIFALASSVATGALFCGAKPVRQGPWLQLDMEGNERRTQKRMAIVRAGASPSDNLHFAHEWPPMDAGGLDLLEAKIQKEKLVGVGIDIWGMFRPTRPKNADPYQHDHHSARQVAELAHRTKCGIFLIHHNRKAEALDWTAEVLGSNGLSAGCDTIAVLTRKRGEADAVLKITGRDVDEQELALSFKDGRWTILGDALEVLMGKTRQTIHSALCFAGKPMRPAEVAAATELNRSLVKQTLLRMLRDGTVRADAQGYYTAVSGTER
jgi:AAA domain